MRKRKRIVVASLFSGMDIFLLGCIKAGMFPGFQVEKNIYAALMSAANFKYRDGTPVIEFINISEEEYKFKKAHKGEDGKKDMEDEVIIKDGNYIRTKSIEEINGAEIRAAIEKHYGKDVIIILIGGPPCQDIISYNKKKRVGKSNRNRLCFEYLRVLQELNPDVAIMEQSTEFLSFEDGDLYNEFMSKATQLNFRLSEMEMNSSNYFSNQQRFREIWMFVNIALGKAPVFPTPHPERAKRIRDFLSVDFIHSGDFCSKFKYPNDFMGTTTSGAPAYYYKGIKKWVPSVEEKLLCIDVYPGDYIIPPSIPVDQVKKAIGNVVVMALAKSLAECVIKDILCLKPDGDGYFVPIDIPDDSTPDNDGAGVPVDTTPVPTAPIDGGESSAADNVPAVNDCNAPNETAPDSPTDKGGSGEPVVTPLKKNPEDVSGASIPTPEIILPVANETDPVRPPSSNNTDAAKDKAQQTEPSPVKVFTPSIITNPPAPFRNTYSQKIISSKQLIDMRFETWKFQGRWLEFMGAPSVTFHLAVFGLPGNGKSTFCIQFAKYLADNFGKTIFISSEEGYSVTLQQKLVNSNAQAINLDVADFRSGDDIIRDAQLGKYHFIFLDSLDRMNIDADKLRMLRAKYKNVAFITISQSTKGGLMRGSQEIAHDCDILVSVENLFAITMKNRFTSTGKGFNVREEMSDSKTEQVNDSSSTNEKKPQQDDESITQQENIVAAAEDIINTTYNKITLEELKQRLIEATEVENYELCKELKDEIAKRESENQ